MEARVATTASNSRKLGAVCWPHKLPRMVASRVVAVAIDQAITDSLAVFLITRGFFILLTYFGVILFNSSLHGPHRSFLHSLLLHWTNHWDTAWYVRIASSGYAWSNGWGIRPASFFPLFPLTIRLTAVLTHTSYIAAALTISNFAFLGALIYLRRLAAWELDAEAANRTILYIALFPTALFFSRGYTESLFLLLTVASFYYTRRRRWLLAGLLAGLASATRVTGVLLVLPLVYEYARAHGFSPRRMLGTGLLGPVLAPSGLVAFMAYLDVTLGSPLAFDRDEASWHHILTWQVWAGPLQSAREILVLQPPASYFQAHNVINLGIAVLFLVWTVFAARRLPAAYTIYTIAFWLVTLASPAMTHGYPVPLVSVARYVLVLFPTFMYIATLGSNRYFNQGYLVLSTSLLALLTLQFVNGGWVV